ncbi:MAG TPA: hypothetical protein VM365_10315 [Gemmatimonadales bacterium]|jgi:hypothetical protein|nr:hypothetical protein [Gemmatimonadales bacterium]
MMVSLRGPAEHTAEDATPGELRRSVLILLLMLAALALLVTPLLRDLPLLGKSTRTAILAWLLVGLALYWMYAGMGYRPLLLVQLLLFSAAAALLSVKLLLVVVSIESLTILRWFARWLIMAGAVVAGANLTGMLIALTLKRTGPSGQA